MKLTIYNTVGSQKVFEQKFSLYRERREPSKSKNFIVRRAKIIVLNR